MTSDGLVTEVRVRWGETDSANSVISNVDILAYLNEAQLTLATVGNVMCTCAKVDLVANQEEYSLPTDYLKAETVFYIGTQGYPTKLIPISVIDRDPNKTAGVPTRYYIWGSNVAGANQYVIGFCYGVTSASETQAIDLFYRQKPAIMVLASPGPAINPEVDTPWQYAMIEMALMRIYQRMGPSYINQLNMATAKWNEWLERAKQYMNPMQFDVPLQRRDTGGYTYEYWNE